MHIESLTLAASIAPLSTPMPMTGPLWGLVIFILWAIAVIALLLVVRIRHLAAGGSPKDFGTPDEQSLLWRLFRVQSNLAENLPLYLGVVVLLVVRGAAGGAIDGLVALYILARLFHSIVHIAGGPPTWRLVNFIVQLGCLMGLTTLAIAPLG